MKPQSHKETFLQTAIIVTCLLVVYFTYFVGNTESQSCTAIPPLYTDRDPHAWSWPSGKQVNFVIDDQWTNQTDRQAFANGITKWNDWKLYNCSAVTFIVTGSQHFTDYSMPPPDYTVYWQKTDPQNGRGGAVIANFGGTPRRIISVNQRISPTASNTNNFFNYLGTHEMGHTLALTIV